MSNPDTRPGSADQSAPDFVNQLAAAEGSLCPELDGTEINVPADNSLTWSDERFKKILFLAQDDEATNMRVKAIYEEKLVVLILKRKGGATYTIDHVEPLTTSPIDRP